MIPGWRVLLSGKRNFLLGLTLLSCISVICVAFNIAGSDNFDISRREVLLRRIGHELLLQSGDNTSRVLPIKKIAENEYQIGFEKDLSFRPDSLVNMTRRVLAQDPLTGDYVVNVLNSSNASVAYGYAISKNKKNDIITCMGRAQPRARYMIDIKFKPTGIDAAKTGYLLSSISILALVGFVFFRSVKPSPSHLPASEAVSHDSGRNTHHDTGTFILGSTVFDPKNRKLTIDEKTIDLTATETRVLLIFATSPNETIERSRLQKEIWEDAGVIVGRSLDMFISKLRKKLELDPHTNIVVIRGKGYKLEISA